MGAPLFFESILHTNTLKRLKKMLTSRNVPPPPFSRFLRNRDPVRNYDPGNWVQYLTRSLLSRMDPGARLGLGGGARACRLDSFFGFLVLPGLVDLIRFAVFAKNRTSGRHRLAPPGFVWSVAWLVDLIRFGVWDFIPGLVDLIRFATREHQFCPIL